MDLIEIGLKIKEARKNYGLTLRELSELTNEDYSNLSKIEKGKINVGLDRFLKIIEVLNFNLKHDFVNPTTLKNIDLINGKLGKETLKDIASLLKVDKTKLKKDLIKLAKLGKVDSEKIKTIKPKAVKYKKEIELFQKMEVGNVEKIEVKSINEMSYLRSVLKKMKPKKDFLTKRVSALIYIVVRIL